MASPQEVNRQVALALGRVIIPLAKADCHTHAEGVTYLYSHSDCLWFGISEDSGQWSPATDPADALACLEEWCRLYLCAASLHHTPNPGGTWGCESMGELVFAPTLSEAICLRILAQSNAEAGT
jgi:hypothetical protein